MTIPPAPVQSRGTKKLIEFGWDEPSADDLREHIGAMEQTPFDGVVLNVHYRDAAGARQVLEWTGFGRTPITWEALQPAVADLKATRFHRFTDNFLRFNTSPGDVDWFDDFGAILHNARMAARVARRGRLKGILFDEEAYNAPLFEYPSQRYRAARSFDVYDAQVRLRGEEIMRAFQEEYPGLTVFLTFGYDVAGSKPAELLTGRYGLLAPFLDGLYSAARGRTTIVDGYESSYGFGAPERFETAYQIIHQRDLAVCGAREAYKRRVSAGFGIWMDRDWRRYGWNETDFSRNFHSPEQFRQVLSAALKRCDRYVWVYTEQPRWWPRTRLPEAYVDAVWAARQENGMSPAGTDPDRARGMLRSIDRKVTTTPGG